MKVTCVSWILAVDGSLFMLLLILNLHTKLVRYSFLRKLTISLVQRLFPLSVAVKVSTGGSRG